MNISAQETGKKFGNEWVIKNFTFEFTTEHPVAILGGNGSGKSTLLKMLSGFMKPSAGTIHYYQNNQEISSEHIFNKISYAAPYLELIEEFSCIETIAFQSLFKPFVNQLTSEDVLEQSGLAHAAKKQVRFFSSGMKQKLKLTLAIMANCPILLLDEPCSNLDAKAIDWYHYMLKTFAQNKLIIICSNHLQYEYEICKKEINTALFK